MDEQSAASAKFHAFAAPYGGPLPPDAPEFNPNTQPWLGQTFAGWAKVSKFYDGRKNPHGTTYRAIEGVFDSMDLIGAAAKREDVYCVGCSIGLALRFQVGWLALLGRSEAPPDAQALSWILGAHPDDPKPQSYGTIDDSLAKDTTGVADACRAGFFSVGFVWMHESFHTLLGHTDLASAALGLGMDEHEMPVKTGPYEELFQTLELEADAASLSNVAVAVAQAPGFGMGKARDPSPASVVGEVGAASVLSLIAIEARRHRLNAHTELSHPFPRRRIGSLKRLVQRLEAKGHLPSGSDAAIARRLAELRPKLNGVAGAELLDISIGNTTVQEDDVSRLEYLASRYGNELRGLEATAFVSKTA